MIPLIGLLFITAILLTANMMMSRYDYMHPACLTCLIFLAVEMVCLINVNKYAIIFHWRTTAVIASALLVFTLFNYLLSHFNYSETERNIHKLQPIHLNSILVILLILLQMVTIYYFKQYLDTVATIYNQRYGENISGLSAEIKLYDTLTKFWTDKWADMNVAVPTVYRIGNPLSMAGASLIIYVAANNWVAEKIINPLYLIVILLLDIWILMNGSRSPLLRYITMFVFLVYFFRYNTRNGSEAIIESKRKKFFFRLIEISAVVAVGSVLTLFLTGRSSSLSGKLDTYFFTYIGAPLINLDNWLSSNVIAPNEQLFGMQTFKSFYNYFGKHLGIEAWQNYSDLNAFAFSNNGIEIGNVYTTFKVFIYDFGYFGVLPLTAIIAAFYTFLYEKMCRKGTLDMIDFRLFIYSYLFNDLVMLFFSNRFFETVLEGSFIKLLVCSYIYTVLFLNRSVKVGNYKLCI